MKVDYKILAEIETEDYIETIGKINDIFEDEFEGKIIRITAYRFFPREYEES